MKFVKGTRVKRILRSDYPHEMAGTVVTYWKGLVVVQWDCDPPGQWTGQPRPDSGPTPTRTEDLEAL